MAEVQGNNFPDFAGNSSGLLTTFGGSQEFLLRAWQPQAAKPAAKKTRAAVVECRFIEHVQRGIRHLRSYLRGYLPPVPNRLCSAELGSALSKEEVTNDDSLEKKGSHVRSCFDDYTCAGNNRRQ